MALHDFFKKYREQKSYSNDVQKLEGVYQIINTLWGVDGVKQVVCECKETINFLITEEKVIRKTDLLSAGLELTLVRLEKANKNPNLSLGSNCITAFIYYRCFFESVLKLDTDIIYVSEHYTIFQVEKNIPLDMHPYIQTMIKTYDLLDRGIIYLYENIENISKDYFSVVSAKIQAMLDEYKDDNTDWNKIFNLLK